METDTRLYHNPRCSKSRAALELLRERGIEPRIVPYLDEPPDAAELRRLVSMTGGDARALVRVGEADYAALALAAASEDELIAAMVQNPRLIERPIFVHGGRAVVARPAERVLDLLGGDTTTR